MIKKKMAQTKRGKPDGPVQSVPAAMNTTIADDAHNRMFLQTSPRSEASWAVTLARCEEVDEMREDRGTGENALF